MSFDYFSIFIHKIQQLSSELGEELLSNNTGHVVRLQETIVVIQIFFALYSVSFFFLAFVLVFVSFSVVQSEWYKDHKPEKYPYFFWSTVVIAWFLISAHVVVCIILTASEHIQIDINSISDLHDWRRLFSSDFNSRIIYTIIICHDFAIIASISFCLIGLCICCGRKKGTGRCDRCKKAFYEMSKFSLIIYALILLWQIVPAMCHLILHPFFTLCIISQYLATLFLLHLGVYEMVNCCAACISFKKECTCMPCCKYFFLLLVTCSGLAIILITGFLYFTVMYMGVSTTRMTMFVIGIMTAVMTATTGGIIRDFIMNRQQIPPWQHHELADVTTVQTGDHGTDTPTQMEIPSQNDDCFHSDNPFAN